MGLLRDAVEARSLRVRVQELESQLKTERARRSEAELHLAALRDIAKQIRDIVNNVPLD